VGFTTPSDGAVPFGAALFLCAAGDLSIKLTRIPVNPIRQVIMALLNIILALVSIVLGAVGWFAPRHVAGLLDLTVGATTMGLSEIRAASGALFVGLGAGVLILQTPQAAAMLGFAWGGAAIGRLTSIVMDGPTPQKWAFFACEIIVAAIALWNLVPRG
jgi:hypothetical protein